MGAAANHLRRLVASIMLAAMASFVLHGAAMAGFHAHTGGSVQCQSASAHVHQGGTHDHGDGTAHVHAAKHAVDVSGYDQNGTGGDHANSDGACCSSVCSVTLTVPGISLVSAPMRLARTLPPESQVGSGIDQGGLKRPPRTSGIA